MRSWKGRALQNNGMWRGNSSMYEHSCSSNKPNSYQEIVSLLTSLYTLFFHNHSRFPLPKLRTYLLVLILLWLYTLIYIFNFQNCFRCESDLLCDQDWLKLTQGRPGCMKTDFSSLPVRDQGLVCHYCCKSSNGSACNTKVIPDDVKDIITRGKLHMTFLFQRFLLWYTLKILVKLFVSQSRIIASFTLKCVPQVGFMWVISEKQWFIVWFSWTEWYTRKDICCQLCCLYENFEW